MEIIFSKIKGAFLQGSFFSVQISVIEEVKVMAGKEAAEADSD